MNSKYIIHPLNSTTLRQVILYIAISLDGMVAKKDGSVAWLDEIPHPENEDYGYFDFYKSINTTIMGNKTYQQVLGFDVPFPYPDKKNFVFTRNANLDKDEHVTYISTDHVEFIKNLKEQPGENIWLIGGGEINTLFLNHDLIDQIIVHVMPVVLGEGIPLFGGVPNQKNLKLLKSKSFPSGVLELVYQLNPTQ